MSRRRMESDPCGLSHEGRSTEGQTDWVHKLIIELLEINIYNIFIN